MQNNDIGLTKNKVNHYIMLVWRQGMFSTFILLYGVAVVQYNVTVLVAGMNNLYIYTYIYMCILKKMLYSSLV